MDSNSNALYAAGLPAFISTGITFIYFLLKACRYVFHAIPHQTEGGLAMTTPGCGKQKHSSTTGTEGHSEVCDEILGHFTEQYGGGTQRSSGSLFLSERGKTYASLPIEMLQNIQKSPLFKKMQKDCQAEGFEIPKTLMAKDPVTYVLTPQEYLPNVEAGTMPLMNNHQMMKEMAENATGHDQTKFLMMEFCDIECLMRPKTPQSQKRK